MLCRSLVGKYLEVLDVYRIFVEVFILCGSLVGKL